MKKELKEEVIKKVSMLMKDPGVRVCMEQGSVGFENFIQVGLAGHLQKKFPSKMVMIESDPKLLLASDILIKEKKEGEEFVVAAFELKIVRLGTTNGDGIKMSEILSDIGKLKVNGLKDALRILICCVYLYGKKKVKNSWGELNQQENNKDQRQFVVEEAGSENSELVIINVEGTLMGVDLFEIVS